MTPVDAPCFSHRLAPAPQRPDELAARLDRLRPREQLLIQRDELVCARLIRCTDGWLIRGMNRFTLGRCLAIACRCTTLNLLELRRKLRVQCLHFIRGDNPLVDQALSPDFARRRMQLDLRVHSRLRERGLVGLVVSVTPVPDQIYEKILAVLRTILYAELHYPDARVGVFRVHVNDRHLEALREIARVMSRSSVHRISGESDLIVRDDVKRAADAISSQPRHVERLRDDSLTRKCSVTVNHHRHHD